jgi:tRNA A37 threonylcarbamoyladenosine modification protein TsaB
MAALDAGRGDVYVGEHELPATPRSVAREYLLTASEFLSHAKGWTVVTHDGGLASSASADGLSVTVIPPLTAAGVAHLGWLKIQQGATVTPDELEANYIRRTDAEMLEKIRS